ncbi:DUF308 domain-containing protein [Myroides sp. 1354]|uniref:HdeD family acid-resistance protein n=1 Tax=unclassified Myroides TaxID=2642485 RepID=UPI002575CB14|nr:MULTISPECIES: DUF308 domain-containing protein [unclassified Myroides]MDM1044403.1 DUF308 domain-containing protein [Myroides sp. R163-1]MDM1056278.1 DUF308 domain-containing protein [Myroides sp. 1354]MDM1069366.1 DUF308 domain-containing protein [Myroides sp. 1372]
MSSIILNRIKQNVKHWYLPVILGVVFILAGIFIMMTPVASYLSLALLFSWLFFFSGIAEIAFALSNRKQLDGWGWILFSGIVDVVLGLILLSKPAITLQVLPIYVGCVLLFRSVRSLSMAVELNNYGVKGISSMVLFGILGLLFAIFMMTNLEAGAFTIVYWTAFSIMTLGLFSILYGMKLKKLKNRGAKISDELTKKWEAIQEEVRKAMDKDE